MAGLTGRRRFKRTTASCEFGDGITTPARLTPITKDSGAEKWVAENEKEFHHEKASAACGRNQTERTTKDTKKEVTKKMDGRNTNLR
jgi:hypothetical protein